MKGDADDAGDDFGQAMRMCKQFGIAETIDNEHADDGWADDGTEIEDDFRRLFAAAEGGENKAADAVSHEKHDDYPRPNV